MLEGFPKSTQRPLKRLQDFLFLPWVNTGDFGYFVSRDREENKSLRESANACSSGLRVGAAGFCAHIALRGILRGLRLFLGFALCGDDVAVLRDLLSELEPTVVSKQFAGIGILAVHLGRGTSYLRSSTCFCAFSCSRRASIIRQPAFNRPSFSLG